MRALLVASLLAVICAETVVSESRRCVDKWGASCEQPTLCPAESLHSLACYYCENEPSNWNCMSMKTCAQTDNYCTTIKKVSRGRNGEPDDYRISKRCAPTCQENFVDTGSSSVATKCCEFSFCNISGAASVKMSSTVLVLGILASLCYIFQSR